MTDEPDALVFEWFNRYGQISAPPPRSGCTKEATWSGLAGAH